MTEIEKAVDEYGRACMACRQYSAMDSARAALLAAITQREAGARGLEADNALAAIRDLLSQRGISLGHTPLHAVKAVMALTRVSDATESQRAALDALLGLSNAWTLENTLRLMAGAVRHLMVDHDCDQHGWENVNETREKALAYADLAVKAHRALITKGTT